MAALRSVLFDVDDTLYATTAFAEHARRNAVQAMVAAGLAFGVDEVLRELDEVILEFSSNYEHHFDKLLLRLAPRGLVGVNPALVVAAGVVAYHDTKFRELAPFPDARPLLDALRAVGIQTGVVTHGLTAKQAEKLIRLGLLDAFDPEAIFISDQIGISKPNPKLYARVLKRLGREPGEVMYVGDNPTHDIEPAASLGIITVWSRRASKKTRPPGIRPDHEVWDFEELAAVLREEYDVDVRLSARRLR